MTQMVSKQPRFNEPTNAFHTVAQWAISAYQLEPPLSSDSRARDQWLAAFWRQEPHLAGVLNSVVNIDKNRGWEMIGGRNQVSRFSRVLYNAEGGAGWRQFFALQAQSYYTADIGAVTECGRDNVGRLAGLWHVDPTICRLTGKPDAPLEYRPKGRVQRWTPGDYVRTVSMPSVQEMLNGVGLCAVSRALRVAQMMVAVIDHDREMLGASAPKGFMLVSGMSQNQWEDAMALRRERMANDPSGALSNVMVLANDQIPVDAKLLSLSQLPADFQLSEWIELLMQAYALCFGYDVSEFYSIKTGSLGNSTQSAVQSQKATAKGERDFTRSWADSVQSELPESLVLQFDERSDEGDLVIAQIQKLQAEITTMLHESSDGLTPGLLSREEARQVLVNRGMIPREWLDVESESAAANDLQETRRRCSDLYAVRRAAELFPDDPIVQYRHATQKMHILYSSGRDFLHRRAYPISPIVTQRAAEAGAVVYSKKGVKITVGDIEKAIEEAEEIDPMLAGLLQAAPDTGEGGTQDLPVDTDPQGESEEP